MPEPLREQWEAKQAAIRTMGALAEPHKAKAVAADRSATPIAVVDEAEFDFGMLDAGTSAQHVFTIRNEGDAPLAITAADTSCKCTLSETSAEWVAPGSTASVTLTWNTGQTSQHYRQYAMIRTNDPNNREIELAIRGRIETQLGFSTDELTAAGVSPGSPAEAETIVFSQTLDAFEISEVHCELPGFQFRVESVSSELLRSLAARSAWRLCVSTDGSLELGPFVDAIRIGIRSQQLSEQNAPLIREILFRGNVLSPVTFYGSKLFRDRGLELGITNVGTELVAHVVVRVRGDHPPSTMEVSAKEPPFLKTEMTPITSRPGVYRLTITVPADAPQTIFNTEQKHGFVEVRDPENPTLRNRFPIYGAVLAL